MLYGVAPSHIFFFNDTARTEIYTLSLHDALPIWGQLEKRGEDAAAAGDGLVGCAQRALHDVLVRAPVPQADNGRAEQHAEPWEIVVEVPGLLDDLADGVGLNHRRPGTLYTGGDERLPEVEHIGAAQAAQLVPASQADQAVGGQQERAEDEDRDLHGVVVSHGTHAAQRGVKAGEHDHQHRADPKAVDNDAADIDGHLREQRAEDDAAGEDTDRDFGDDESDYGDDGEDVTGL